MDAHLLDVLTFVAGAGAIVAGCLLPVAAPYLIPAGVGFMALAVKQPSKFLPEKKDDSQN